MALLRIQPRRAAGPRHSAEPSWTASASSAASSATSCVAPPRPLSACARVPSCNITAQGPAECSTRRRPPAAKGEARSANQVQGSPEKSEAQRGKRRERRGNGCRFCCKPCGALDLGCPDIKRHGVVTLQVEQGSTASTGTQRLPGAGGLQNHRVVPDGDICAVSGPWARDHGRGADSKFPRRGAPGEPSSHARNPNGLRRSEDGEFTASIFSLFNLLPARHCTARLEVYLVRLLHRRRHQSKDSNGWLPSGAVARVSEWAVACRGHSRMPMACAGAGPRPRPAR